MLETRGPKITPKPILSGTPRVLLVHPQFRTDDQKGCLLLAQPWARACPVPRVATMATL